MRAITAQEQAQMALATEKRLTGLSHISFLCSKREGMYGGATTTEWTESGFFGSFDSGGGSRQVVGNLGGVLYVTPATCVIPLKYWDSMVVMNPASSALGQSFQITMNTVQENYSGHVQCYRLTVQNIGGVEPHFQYSFVYKITEEPHITGDAVVLTLEATTQIYRNDADHFILNRLGYLGADGTVNFNYGRK